MIQAAWAILLNKYTQQNDLLFGVTVSGRAIDLPGIENMLGLCINTVPLRVQLLDNDDLDSLVRRIQIDMAEIQQFSYLPLARIRNLLELGSGSGLFNTIFVFENYPKNFHSNEALELSLISAMSKGEYPLGITVVTGQRLMLKFDYSVDAYSENFINNLANNLQEILLTLID